MLHHKTIGNCMRRIESHNSLMGVFRWSLHWFLLLLECSFCCNNPHWLSGYISNFVCMNWMLSNRGEVIICCWSRPCCLIAIKRLQHIFNKHFWQCCSTIYSFANIWLMNGSSNRVVVCHYICRHTNDINSGWHFLSQHACIHCVIKYDRRK